MKLVECGTWAKFTPVLVTRVFKAWYPHSSEIFACGRRSLSVAIEGRSLEHVVVRKVRGRHEPRKSEPARRSSLCFGGVGTYGTINTIQNRTKRSLNHE